MNTKRDEIDRRLSRISSRRIRPGWRSVRLGEYRRAHDWKWSTTANQYVPCRGRESFWVKRPLGLRIGIRPARVTAKCGDIIRRTRPPWNVPPWDS